MTHAATNIPAPKKRPGLLITAGLPALALWGLIFAVRALL